MEKHLTIIELINHMEGFPIASEKKAHMDGCKECAERLTQIQREQENLMFFKNPERMARDVLDKATGAERKGRGWLLIPAFGLAAVFALVLVFLLVLPKHETTSIPPVEDGIRMKGSLSVSHQVERDGRLIHPEKGFIYQAKDKILLDLLTPENGFVSIYYIENGIERPIPELQNIPVAGREITKIQGKLELTCDGSEERIVIYFDSRKMESATSTVKVRESIPMRCQ
jgi:hypothetical protein